MPNREAYVPVTAGDSFGIGAANAYTRGYVLVESGYQTYEAARDEADRRNRAAGISQREANAVHICSMFRPGQYDDVYASL